MTNRSERCGVILQSLAPTNTPGTVPSQIGKTRLQSTVPRLMCPREVKINKIAACAISVPTNLRESSWKKAIITSANIEPEATLVIATTQPKIAATPNVLRRTQVSI